MPAVALWQPVRVEYERRLGVLVGEQPEQAPRHPGPAAKHPASGPFFKRSCVVDVVGEHGSGSTASQAGSRRSVSHDRPVYREGLVGSGDMTGVATRHSSESAADVPPGLQGTDRRARFLALRCLTLPPLVRFGSLNGEREVQDPYRVSSHEPNSRHQTACPGSSRAAPLRPPTLRTGASTRRAHARSAA